MTLDEIRREAAALSSDERLRLSFYLEHLQRVDSEENKAELSRIERAFDEGKGFTLDQVREMHAALEAQGH